MASLQVEMLANIRREWEKHDRECARPPKAILMHPGNFQLIGWHEVFGLPVLPDERVEPKRAKLLCGVGAGGYCTEGDVFWDETGKAWLIPPASTDEV